MWTLESGVEPGRFSMFDFFFPLLHFWELKEEKKKDEKEFLVVFGF